MNTFVRSCWEDLLQLLGDRTMKPIFIFIFVGCSKGGGPGEGGRRRRQLCIDGKGMRNSDRRW